MKFFSIAFTLLAHSEIFRDSHGRFVDLTHEHPLWSNFNKGKPLLEDSPVCRTHECYNAALNLWQSVNTSVDPCQDFYAYACGKWIENNPVPATQRTWNKFSILTDEMDKRILKMLQQPVEENELEPIKTVKKIFSACMDEERIEDQGLKPLIKQLDELGGWPMAGWNMTGVEWYLLVARSTRLFGVAPLLEVSVSIDKRNTSRSIITVDEPTLTLPRYELADGVSNILSAYRDYIANIAELLSKSYGHPLPKAAFLMEAESLVKFEVKLAQIKRKDRDRGDLQKSYHKVNLSRLQQVTNSVPIMNRATTLRWLPFLATLLKGIVPIEEINQNTEIVVTDIHFLYHLLLLIDATPARVIVNYIQWRLVETMSRDVNKAMRDLTFGFNKKTWNVEEDVPRWYECVDSARNLDFIIGFMYVNEHFSLNGKEKASEMVTKIKNTFTRQLNEIKWMDEATKTTAAQKADLMNELMGYPPWYANQSALINVYSGLKIGRNHFENMASVRQVLTRNSLEKLKIETDRSQWLFGPAVVNAFYTPELNYINFPAGILQQPFFSAKQPDSLNYGSIGVIIGHEISHGFDDTGRQRDKMGNLHYWWTKETEKTYQEKSQCFVDQYHKYRVPEIDHLLKEPATVNGLSTLGENIADNGGLRAAYKAYKGSQSEREEERLPGWEHITPDQLFFLGFANVWCEANTPSALLSEVMDDSHSPHKYRVLGTLSNSVEFASAWHCPSGSPMNPPDKCTLW